jgi:phage antirepressor YoqD-like protein
MSKPNNMDRHFTKPRLNLLKIGSSFKAIQLSKQKKMHSFLADTMYLISLHHRQHLITRSTQQQWKGLRTNEIVTNNKQMKTIKLGAKKLWKRMVMGSGSKCLIWTARKYPVIYLIEV